MNILQERLQSAIDKKNSDVNTFVWKGHKVLDETGTYKQTEKKLMTMSESELKVCYEHCKTMLYNKDLQNPGRYVVLELIADQKDHCGVELLLRYVEQNSGLSRFSLIGAINTFTANNREALKEIKPIIGIVFSDLPDEFQKLPLGLIIDGCLDRLGAFNKKHITRTFILKQGIWLTTTESKELVEHEADGTLVDRLLVIRERLNIKDIEKLYLNAKGLNYTQMRAMLNIKPNKKYMELTTAQLETLRNKILFSLEETVRGHITSWERRMEEIEMVMENKKFKL
ncbi:MAG: hypothetical protein ACOH2V_00825 [Candidatus Saccharimonadaceae bacterium]